MRIRLTQLNIDLDYTEQSLRQAIAGKLGVVDQALLSCVVTRRSIDARKFHGPVCLSLTVEAEISVPADSSLPAAWQEKAGIKLLSESVPSALPGAKAIRRRLSPRDPPVVVGAGPAGILAAWRLAGAGLCPILIERGAPVEHRRATVERFRSHGIVDAEDNILFGEGGAGLYSDGKLTTRTRFRGHLRTVLELLVQCGADESILVDVEPHVGSDRLTEIILRLHEKIVGQGVDVRFHSRLEGLELHRDKLTGLVVNGQRLKTSDCLLATGHSARDVYEMLYRLGVTMLPKSFAIGVRIEVPQRQIDESQFGLMAGHPRLGAANFRLTRRGTGSARACYTFCMCPGGSVIACASSPGMLTTNGMSLSARSGVYGNAAFLVPVNPDDFGGSPDNPLSGIVRQADIEAKAFRAGGSDFALPACALPDFLAGRISSSLPHDRSCPRSTPANLHEALPDYVSETLLQAVPRMIRKLRNVAFEQSVVYGVETRSSSPVRIVRDETFQSPSVRGLYPVGEGAGYAGGIVTSAIDGLRAAESLLQESG